MCKFYFQEQHKVPARERGVTTLLHSQSACATRLRAIDADNRIAPVAHHITSAEVRLQTVGPARTTKLGQ
jgi:hypothetical protein